MEGDVRRWEEVIEAVAKQCARCPAFVATPRHKVCKTCQREAHLLWNRKNAARLNAVCRARRAKQRVTTKQCARCPAPVETPRHKVCKACRRQRKREVHRIWERKNAARLNAERRAWNAKHPDKVAQYRKTRNEKFPNYRDVGRGLAARLVDSAKRRAQKAGIPFSLKPEDVAVPEFCPILGIRLQVNRGGSRISSPTLDRIIPHRGYVAGNVRIISLRANVMKSDGNAEEHRKIADYIEGRI